MNCFIAHNCCMHCLALVVLLSGLNKSASGKIYSERPVLSSSIFVRSDTELTQM